MKQPYTITAYIPDTQPHTAQFKTDLTLQTHAHAAGIGEHLHLQIHQIPAIQIKFTAPPDPIAPEYPRQDAQNAILRLITAEIRQRWPHARPKFKLYRTP